MFSVEVVVLIFHLYISVQFFFGNNLKLVSWLSFVNISVEVGRRGWWRFLVASESMTRTWKNGQPMLKGCSISSQLIRLKESSGYLCNARPSGDR